MDNSSDSYAHLINEIHEMSRRQSSGLSSGESYFTGVICAKLHPFPLSLPRWRSRLFGAGGTMGSVSDTQANGDRQPPPAEDAGAAQVEEGETSETMEGVASIALLPSGAISGHFICLPDSICYGLHGTPISCERECSRGEDYCLIKLSIINFKRKTEKVVVVECRGHDAARLQNIDHLHGWEDDIVGLVQKTHGNKKVLFSFECETLKADKAAEEHISKHMPNLCGLDAVVNTGKMNISGINLDEDDEPSGDS